MKIGDKIEDNDFYQRNIYLNRLRGISYTQNLLKNDDVEINISFHIHDKKEDWKVVGTANVNFYNNEKKTMSHGKLPGKSVVLEWVKIDGEYRKKNLGKKLVSYIEEQGKEKGMEMMFATSVMADAKGFWKKMGFQWSGELRNWTKKL